MLPFHAKLSLELNNCKLTDAKSADQLLSSNIFNFSTSMSLFDTSFPPNFLNQIGNHLNSTENLYYFTNDSSEYDTLLPLLCTATQLTGLHLRDYVEDKQHLRTLLPRLSNLEEISLVDAYSDSLLPCLSCSGLKYLDLSYMNDPTGKDILLQILSSSTDTLRGLRLAHLRCLDEMLVSISACTNLVCIELEYTELEPDSTLLGTTVSRLRSLVYLHLGSCPTKSYRVVTSVHRPCAPSYYPGFTTELL